MSARNPRRWWIPFTFQAPKSAGTFLHPIRKGRNITLEGIGAGDSADTGGVHLYCMAQGLNGNTQDLLPTEHDGTGLEQTMILPSLANYRINRREFITSPMDYCDIDHILIWANNNTLTDTYVVGHIRGQSW